MGTNFKKIQEEIPLLYDEEESCNKILRPILPGDDWKDASVYTKRSASQLNPSPGINVDEGAAVQMDKAFLPVTALQLGNSFKALLLVVASLVIIFVMCKIVVNVAIVPFATTIFIVLFSG